MVNSDFDEYGEAGGGDRGCVCGVENKVKTLSGGFRGGDGARVTLTSGGCGFNKCGCAEGGECDCGCGVENQGKSLCCGFGGGADDL